MVLSVADNDKEVVLRSQSAFANQRNRSRIFLSFIHYFFLYFSLSHLISLSKKLKIKLHGLSPRANYTDRATAACRRSYCQLFADRGCHVVSVTDPYGCILGFLDRCRYFSIK
jgi:hypothetical protein